MKPWVKALIVAIVATTTGLLAGALFMIAIGANPLQGYWYLLQGSFSSGRRFADFLATSAPLILSGLSVAFAFRTGLFNIGVAGQFLIGGLCASLVGLFVDIPQVTRVLLMGLAAVGGGALWGFIPGLLKAKFNVHEVVSTIMLNWIAVKFVDQAVPAWIKGTNETVSRYLSHESTLRFDWLSRLFLDKDNQGALASMTDPSAARDFILDSSSVNIGIFIAAAVAVLVLVILNRTVLGYQLKAVGFNRYAAEYAGIKVDQKITVSMLISGAIAGAAGLTYYAGYAINIQIGVLPSQGIDGIAIALLGACSPIGVFGVGLVFGTLQNGRGFMSALTDIPPEIGEVIVAIIIYFAATAVLIETALEKFRSRIGDFLDKYRVAMGVGLAAVSATALMLRSTIVQAPEILAISILLEFLLLVFVLAYLRRAAGLEPHRAGRYLFIGTGTVFFFLSLVDIGYALLPSEDWTRLSILGSLSMVAGGLLEVGTGILLLLRARMRAKWFLGILFALCGLVSLLAVTQTCTFLQLAVVQTILCLGVGIDSLAVRQSPGVAEAG